MKPFYVSFGGGCTIVYARTEGGARRYAEHELGRCDGPYRVRLATESDISWVKAMGGFIHRAPAEEVSI